jgi:hypothetical protein
MGLPMRHPILPGWSRNRRRPLLAGPLAAGLLAVMAGGTPLPAQAEQVLKGGGGLPPWAERPGAAEPEASTALEGGEVPPDPAPPANPVIPLEASAVPPQQARPEQVEPRQASAPWQRPGQRESHGQPSGSGTGTGTGSAILRAVDLADLEWRPAPAGEREFGGKTPEAWRTPSGLLTQEPDAEPVPAASAPEPGPWAATFELYSYLPISTIGTSTVKGLETQFDITLPEMLDALRFAAAGRGSLELGRIGLLADLYYVKVGGEGATVVGERQLFEAGAEVGFIQGIYDLALRYRFGEREAAVGEPGQFTIIPYGGIRILQGDIDIKASLAGPLRRFERSESRNFKRTWVQPLVGTWASVFLTPKLKAFLRGDVGGFGLAGDQDLSANAQVGLAYAVGNSTTLNVSYRYLALEWDNGGSRPNAFRSYQNGIEAGVKFFF